MSFKVVNRIDRDFRWDNGSNPYGFNIPFPTTEDNGKVLSVVEGNYSLAAASGGETYTAGDNIQISDANVISATDTKYTAGDNITITNGVISADSELPPSTSVDEGKVLAVDANGDPGWASLSSPASVPSYTTNDGLKQLTVSANGTSVYWENPIVGWVRKDGVRYPMKVQAIRQYCAANSNGSVNVLRSDIVETYAVSQVTVLQDTTKSGHTYPNMIHQVDGTNFTATWGAMHIESPSMYYHRLNYSNNTSLPCYFCVSITYLDLTSGS